MSSRVAGPEPSDVVELTLTGSTPAASQLLRDAKSVRLTLDPEAEAAKESFLVPEPPPPGPHRCGVLVVLAYTLGPFAPLLLRRGRRNGLWAGAALLCLLSWGATIWYWPHLRDWLERGTVPILPWMLWAFATTHLLLVFWSRALHLVGSDTRFIPERLPPWLRQPVVAGALGVVVPGLGHLAAGSPRRAALAFWNAGCVVLMLATLWNSGWLWHCNEAAGSAGVPGLVLEVLILAAAVFGSLGALTWIGSSLDGARLIALRTAQPPILRSDWLAFLLLSTLIVVLALARPASIARDLDRFAQAMQHEEFRLIPLSLELAAMQLDPAEPRYSMQAAELYDSFGKHDVARHIREQMRERWKTYAEQLLHEELHSGPALLPLPIGPAEDPETPSTTDGDDAP